MENYAKYTHIVGVFGDCGALEMKGIPEYITQYNYTSTTREGFQREINEKLNHYPEAKIVFASVNDNIWKEMFEPYGWKVACTRKGNYGDYRMYYIYKILNEEFK